MTVSLARGGVFLLIGLPIGFILAALAFAVSGREIDASAIAPFALAIAILVGLGAAIWKPKA